MLPKAVDKAKFRGFVGEMAAARRVVGPVEKEPGFYVFSDVEDVERLALDYPITLQSPKKYFMPPEETLLTFKADQALAVESVTESEPLVLVGVHPCDVYALRLLKVIFEDTNADPHYLNRCKDAIVIGVDCLKPCDEYSFCADMGSLDAEKGYDLMLTDIGDEYFIDVGTEAGLDLLRDCPGVKPASNAEFAARQKAAEQKRSSFHNRLPVDTRYLPEILTDAYDSLVWQATARRCFSCGSCNLVCPTCYCFDVTDEMALSLQEGERKRRWDGCTLNSFAVVAGGENFREEREDRLRHRIFRKGKYIREKYGLSGCVGCGRCDRVCVGKINSVDIYNQITGSMTA